MVGFLHGTFFHLGVAQDTEGLSQHEGVTSPIASVPRSQVTLEGRTYNHTQQGSQQNTWQILFRSSDAEAKEFNFQDRDDRDTIGPWSKAQRLGQKRSLAKRAESNLLLLWFRYRISPPKAHVLEARSPACGTTGRR